MQRYENTLYSLWYDANTGGGRNKLPENSSPEIDFKLLAESYGIVLDVSATPQTPAETTWASPADFRRVLVAVAALFSPEINFDGL